MLLSLSKAACSHHPTQAKTLASTPKQIILISILLQHIYGYEQLHILISNWGMQILRFICSCSCSPSIINFNYEFLFCGF